MRDLYLLIDIYKILADPANVVLPHIKESSQKNKI